MSGSDLSNAPRPRQCHLKKWPDFQGYGFNLHAEKGKVGQYIGKVDPGSPSAVTGLKENDRIVEVNGVNVGNENHQQVVERIKANPNETKLLVVDKETDDYYREKKLVIRSDQPNVEIRECPDSRTGSAVTTVNAAVNGIAKSERELRPRLCVLRIKPDFQGYGFNLHAEKGKPGQFIGKVDAGSPAEAGGLQEGDHIVEINDENISAQSHADVVNRIKLSPSMVRILVVSGDDWTYAQQNNIHVHNGMPLVQVIDPSQPSAVKSAEVIERAEIAPVAALAAASIESDVPQPRYCHLRKWADFDGYGFNLHAEKGQTGHFIGTVDDNSPGSLSGLKQGDKIVEVNGDNVWNESHSVVVQKIKSNPDVVSLLVVDNEAETYYTSKGISVNSGMDNVKFIYGPDSKPAAGQTISAAPVVAAAAVVASSVDSSAPKLRLCHLKQWSDFNGYGFNLHVEKGRAGHFIGAVDDSSPAYYAGLRKGDRIAEANGNNVWDASHQETVGIIKARGNNVELLVADPAAEEYYRNKGVSINSSLPNIERIVCPDRNPATSQVTAAPAVAVANASSSSLPSDAPAPRLCVLQKRQDFQGYGFNLMVIKDRPGNYIGSIEQGSPAQISGLIENDKIIEVNGDNILEEPHANVVNKIKSNPNQVALLVLDPKADEYYQNNNLIASSSQANVQRIDPSATTSSTSVAAVAAPAAVAAAAVASTPKAPEHQLRASLLRRWPDFQGYGFNLQAAKNREGNYIGGVDAGSPAYYAGLKDGDRIVEVNGIYAFNETHANVVSYITQDPTQVKMVVMDRAAEQYFQNNNLTVNSQMDNAKVIECPAKRPSEAINGTVETKPSPAVTTPVVSTSPDQGTYEDQGNRVIAAETDKIEEAMEKKDEVAVVAHQEETDIRPRTPSPPPPPPPPPMMEDLPPPPPPVEEVNVTNEVKVAEESQESEEKPPSPKMVAPIPPPPFVESPVKEEIREEKVEVQSPVTPVTPTATEIASPSTPISPSSSATPIATKTPTEEEERMIHRSVIELNEDPGSIDKNVAVGGAVMAGGAATVLAVGSEGGYTETYQDNYIDDQYPPGQEIPTTLISAYPVNTVVTDHIEGEHGVSYVEPNYPNDVQVDSYAESATKSTVVVVNSIDEVDRDFNQDVNLQAPEVTVTTHNDDGIQVTTYQEPHVDGSVDIDRSVEVSAPEIADNMTENVTETMTTTVVTTTNVIETNDLPREVEVTHDAPDIEVNHVSVETPSVAVEPPTINVEEVNGEVESHSQTVEVVTTEITESTEINDNTTETTSTTVIMTQPGDLAESTRQNRETVVTEIVSDSDVPEPEVKSVTETHTVTTTVTESVPAPEPPAPSPTLPPVPETSVIQTSSYSSQISRPSPTVNNNVSGPGLNTGLSAAQLREQLRSKKKQDPRKGNMSLQEKKAIYDSL